MSQRQEILGLLEDGRVVTRLELQRLGFSRGTVGRMLDDGTLERVGSSGVRLPGWHDADRWGSVAAAFRGRGVICLMGAARLHDLTDVPNDLAGDGPARDALAVPHAEFVGDRGTGIRVVRWRDPAAFTVGVERREFAAGHSLLVTDPARTVVDLFWPLSGATEGGAREALARLYRTGGDEAMNLCTTYANSFRPARREAVTAAVETLRETVKWTAFP